jgi:hypothetical protein
MMKTSKAYGNQAMIRKMTDPGFNFVPAGAIRVRTLGHVAFGNLHPAP